MASPKTYRCPKCHAHLKFVQGELQHIPRKTELRERNDAIIAMHEAKRTYREIAKKFGISPARARMIVLQREYNQERLREIRSRAG